MRDATSQISNLPASFDHIISGFGLTYPSEKYEFVSWDGDYSQYMESHKIHVPNHQPDPH